MALFADDADLRAGLDTNTKSLWGSLREIRSEVLAALEEARNSKLISSSLEAKVIIAVDEEHVQLNRLLHQYSKELPALFIVSQVNLATTPLQGALRSELVKGLTIKVERADGKKCERCWNYSTHVGDNARYPTVCERCSEALAEIESDASANVAVT